MLQKMQGYVPENACDISRSPQVGNYIDNSSISKMLIIGAFFHAILGYLAIKIPQIADIHAWVTLFIVIIVAAIGKVKLHNIAYMMAYIVGCEIFWRMTTAQIFWETGKYITILIIVIALINYKITSIPFLLFLLFIFTLPGVFYTILTSSITNIHINLSSDYAGIFSLIMCCLFFSYAQLRQRQLFYIFCLVAIPVFSIGGAVTTDLLSKNVIWGGSSNFAVSGGFGPNQVSSALGLGALLIFLIMIFYNKNFIIGILMVLGIIFLITLAILTFSRGGVISAIFAGSIGILHQSINKKNIWNIIIILISVIIFLSYGLPQIETFTQGKFFKRYDFENALDNSRFSTMEKEILTISQNPLGVGVGNAPAYSGRGTHTEFTRLIAEHGILGILILLILLLLALKNCLTQHDIDDRIIVASVLIWTISYMFHSAMRTVAPSFLFGLTFIQIIHLDDDHNYR